MSKKIVINGVNYSQDNPSDDILVHHFDDTLINGEKTYDNKGHEWIHSSSTKADVDTLTKKFGRSGLRIDPTAYVQSEAINELNFGSGDFTIDFWAYISTNTGRMCPFIFSTDGIAIDISNYYPRMWMLDPSGSSWMVHADSAAGGGVGTIALIPFTWSHIALVRNGSLLTLYVDGQQSVQADISNTQIHFIQDTTSIILGTWDDKSSYPFSGYIDELRVTNKAVWTSAFTPPTAPYEDGFTTDIKLNGVTPDKIMLNGQCYFEKPYEPTYLYKWDFTKSLTDEVAGVTATMGNATFTEGVGISGDGWIKLGNYIHNPIGKTYEIDFASFEKTNTNRLSRVLGINGDSFLGYDDQVGYICKKNNSQKTYITTSNIVSFTNKTLKLVFVSDNSLQVYLDDILLYEGDTFAHNTNPGVEFYIGDSAGSSVHAMETFTVTGVRIYENEE